LDKWIKRKKARRRAFGLSSDFPQIAGNKQVVTFLHYFPVFCKAGGKKLKN
jgi:hypothetical protein